MILGIAIAAAGGAMISLPWCFSSHPVDAPEARRLADLRNKALKARLGLSDEQAPSPRGSASATSSLSMTAVPLAYPQGGGLALVGRY